MNPLSPQYSFSCSHCTKSHRSYTRHCDFASTVGVGVGVGKMLPHNVYIKPWFMDVVGVGVGVTLFISRVGVTVGVVG